MASTALPIATSRTPPKRAIASAFATRPEVITQALGIVYRAISGHLIQKAGLTRASAAAGAVTLVERFGSALNLNIHFHMLVPDGVYRQAGSDGRVRFVPVSGPGAAELEALVQTIAERGRSLERAGGSLPGISRTATWPLIPQKTARSTACWVTRSPTGSRPGRGKGRRCSRCRRCRRNGRTSERTWPTSSGFSLHTGVLAKGSERDKLEQLARVGVTACRWRVSVSR